MIHCVYKPQLFFYFFFFPFLVSYITTDDTQANKVFLLRICILAIFILLISSSYSVKHFISFYLFLLWLLWRRETWTRWPPCQVRQTTKHHAHSCVLYCPIWLPSFSCAYWLLHTPKFFSHLVSPSFWIKPKITIFGLRKQQPFGQKVMLLVDMFFSSFLFLFANGEFPSIWSKSPGETRCPTVACEGREGKKARRTPTCCSCRW